MMIRALFLLLVWVLCLPLFGGGAVKVIANAANDRESISKQELKAIFLGEQIHWKDGSKIKIADNLDKEAADEFYRTFVGKKVSRVKKIWIKKMLRGKMNPPESFKDSSALLTYVSAGKYCIGFVTGETAPDGVKVLKVVD
ncbi:MAG: hypothetical protein GY950_16370 [bacterium]|nr:hypothetical protein [bacterium]